MQLRKGATTKNNPEDALAGTAPAWHTFVSLQSLLPATLNFAWAYGVAGEGRGRGRGSLPRLVLRLPRLWGSGSTEVGSLFALCFGAKETD